MKLNKFFVTVVCFSIISGGAAVAASSGLVKSWKIVPAQSKIEFAVAQDKSQLTGSFKDFSAEISFDAAHLANSKAKIEIDLNSLTMSFADAVPTAKNKDWFDVKVFPKAIFQSKKFSKISAEKFHVDGVLSLKGKDLPLGFDFTFKEKSATSAIANAEFTLSRSSFGVGAKDEKSANGVKDLVNVKFSIEAIAQ